MPSDGRYLRSACFTSYLPYPLNFKPEHIRYMVYQQEKCPKTNRLHLQGFVMLEAGHRATIKQIREYIGDPGAHIEAVKTSVSRCIAYCKKNETRVSGTEPFEHGTPPIQGSRSDLKPYDDYCQKLYNGLISMADVAAENPALYGLHFKKFQEVKTAGDQKRAQASRKVDVIVFWGDSRAGKTSEAIQIETVQKRTFYILHVDDPKSPPWWDGYDGQDTVIINDFYGQVPLSNVLQWCDGHGNLRVRVKGSHKFATFTRIYFTSNRHYSEWQWPGAHTAEEIASFRNRITKVVQFTLDDSLRASLNTTAVTNESTVTVTAENLRGLKTYVREIPAVQTVTYVPKQDMPGMVTVRRTRDDGELDSQSSGVVVSDPGEHMSQHGSEHHGSDHDIFSEIQALLFADTHLMEAEALPADSLYVPPNDFSDVDSQATTLTQ